MRLSASADQPGPGRPEGTWRAAGPYAEMQPGNAGSGMSEGTRNSIRTIKFWGRPKQEGRRPSFYHTLDCKWKVLSALGVDLPMSIKATSTVLQPRPPAQMIPISDKLASKPTMISASTSVHSCYHRQALQLLFSQGKMSEQGLPSLKTLSGT